MNEVGPRKLEPGGPWIQTFTGRAFWPLDPRSEDVCLEDIARGLSQKCRYNGQSRYFYSVAEHSVRVSWYLECAESPRGVQVAGLLHDGGEAFLPDVPRPVKYAPAFRAFWAPVEAAVDEAVREHFGVSLEHWVDSRVKWVDDSMIETERSAGVVASAPNLPWGPLLPALLALRPLEGAPAPDAWGWSSTEAERVFLRRARALGLS